MSEPSPLDYRKPDPRTSFPWWIIVAATFVGMHIACLATVGVAMAFSRGSTGKIFGINLVLIAMGVAWIEVTFLRHRNSETGFLINFGCAAVALATIVIALASAGELLGIDDWLLESVYAGIITIEVFIVIANVLYWRTDRTRRVEKPSP